MKTKLTKEESQRLLTLGVPKEKASGIDTDNFESMFLLAIEAKANGNGGKSIRNLSSPIFKIEDFLNEEILPKEIEDDETGWWMELSIQYSAPQRKWLVAYHALNEDGVSFVRRSEELIDALYELACWYYGEYLKSENNGTQAIQDV